MVGRESDDIKKRKRRKKRGIKFCVAKAVNSSVRKNAILSKEITSLFQRQDGAFELVISVVYRPVMCTHTRQPQRLEGYSLRESDNLLLSMSDKCNTGANPDGSHGEHNVRSL